MAVSAPTTIGSYASTSNTTTSGAQTASASASIGDVVVATVVGGGTGNTLGFSDSAGNTWTAETAVDVTSGVASTIRAFHSTLTAAITSGASTFTATKSASGGLAFVVEKFTGASGATGTQVSGTSTAAANPATTSAAATTTDGGVLFAAAVLGSTRTATADAPLLDGTSAASSGSGNPRSVWTFYQQITTGGSVTPSAAISVSNPYGMIAFGITAAAADDTETPADNVGITDTASPAKDAVVVVSPQGTLAIIGDSLTERAVSTAAPPDRELPTRAAMVSVGFVDGDIYWYGDGGKTMHSADSNGNTVSANITAARSALTDVDKWVFALGWNDVGDGEATFKSEVNAILDLIYPVGTEPDLVWWMNKAVENPANTNANNQNTWLAEVVAARSESDRIFVADWYGYVHAGTPDSADWLPADVPHMTEQGYAVRDAFIAGVVSEAAYEGGVGLTDAVGVVKAATSTPTDDLGLTDTVTTAKAIVVTVTDGVGLTDTTAAAKAIVVTVTDNLGLVDAATDELAVALSETNTDVLGLTDTTARTLEMARAPPESIGLLDTIERVVTAAREISDGPGLTDSIAVAKSIVVTITDDIGLADDVVPVKMLAVDVIDSVGLLDTVERVAATTREISDDLGLTDNVVDDLVGANTTVVTDVLGLTDTVDRVAAATREITDGVGLTDAVAAAKVIVITITDDLGLTDDATGALAGDGTETITDALGLTDTIAVAKSIAVEITDVLGLTDTATDYLATGDAEETDSLGLTDTVVTARSIVREITDDLGLTDSTSVDEVILGSVSLALLQATVTMRLTSSTAPMRLL